MQQRFKQSLRSLSLSATMFALATGCNTVENTPPPAGPAPVEKDVMAAINKALPDIKSFQLVQIDEKPIVDKLSALAKQAGTTPLTLTLPILGADKKPVEHTWVLYPHNVRASGASLGVWDGEKQAVLNMQPVSETSLTFQGLPDLSDEQFEALLAEVENSKSKSLDESKYQAATMTVIGGHVQASYYGNPDSAKASVIESVENILEPSLGTKEAQRIASGSSKKYVLYDQADFQPKVTHNERPFPGDANPLTTQSNDGVWTQRHVGEAGIKTLRPVMVADATVYDPDTNTWLVRDWLGRVDAAVNQQNYFLQYAQIAPDVAQNAVTPALRLALNNNRVIVKSQIAGYRTVSSAVKRSLSTSGGLCNGSPAYLPTVTDLSANAAANNNEFWMWWTTRYGGGCAWVATLGKTPKGGAVGVSGFGGGTTDWVNFVFMHEAGHIIGGLHSNESNSEGGQETWANHRCKLLGAFEFGPLGPSIMSYAGGTRTYCFASTDPSRSNDKKNASYVAEFLHTALKPGVDPNTDRDHDLRSDFQVWRPGNGTWYTINSSTGNPEEARWGNSGDVPVAGDYDGDGRSDLAVWRPSDSKWYIIESSTGSPRSPIPQLGENGDIPVPGDYDGDGKTDVAMWRPSNATWYVARSTGGLVSQQWGDSGDIPVPGDYDGDGKTDYAVWRPQVANWFVIRSSDGANQVSLHGALGDIPVPGDYDGDGKSDLAVWRPSNGTWYVSNTSGSSANAAVQWGEQNDIPVSGDYDGDGKTDLAVWRPTNATWYVVRSAGRSSITRQWGNYGDVPIRSIVMQLSLRVTVEAGADALDCTADGTRSFGSFIGTVGNVPEFLIAPCIPSNESRSVNVLVRPGIRAQDLTSLNFRVSSRNCTFCTGDRPDINAIRVDLLNGSNPRALLNVTTPFRILVDEFSQSYRLTP